MPFLWRKGLCCELLFVQSRSTVCTLTISVRRTNVLMCRPYVMCVRHRCTKDSRSAFHNSNCWKRKYLFHKSIIPRCTQRIVTIRRRKGSSAAASTASTAAADSCSVSAFWRDGCACACRVAFQRPHLS